MFTFIDFENIYFIVTFLYSMFPIWKRSFSFFMYQRRFYDKGQDIWKSSFLSKKATLTII